MIDRCLFSPRISNGSQRPSINEATILRGERVRVRLRVERALAGLMKDLTDAEQSLRRESAIVAKTAFRNQPYDQQAAVIERDCL